MTRTPMSDEAWSHILEQAGIPAPRRAPAIRAYCPRCRAWVRWAIRWLGR
jgi:hypothetical protein